MANGMPSRNRVNPMAPYFVQLREFERRLIREAYEATGEDLDQTASVLGVHRHYVKARAKLLGGVFGDPKNEPPGLAAKAWQNTVVSGRHRRKATASTPDTLLEPPETDPADA